MPDLDGPVADFYAAYLAELRAGFDAIEPWWSQLRAQHGAERMKLRWPAGRASHPRILAIVRDYYQRVRTLGPKLAPGPAPRFDDDAAWGSEVEAAPTQLLSPDPTELLIDRLHEDDPKLHARMVYVVLPPLATAVEPRPRMDTLAVVKPSHEAPRVFDFGLGHDVRRGLDRLLGAGIDLRPHAMGRVALHDASEPHRLAHMAWQQELERALIEAERWWLDELARRESRGLSAEQARKQLLATHVAGPAGHPRVIGAIQAYWALTHEINHALVDHGQHVAPELLLLAWLRDGRRESWLELLSALPYWPVTLDAAGRWG
jgi:hypothetical protein